MQTKRFRYVMNAEAHTSSCKTIQCLFAIRYVKSLRFGQNKTQVTIRHQPPCHFKNHQFVAWFFCAWSSSMSSPRISSNSSGAIVRVESTSLESTESIATWSVWAKIALWQKEKEPLAKGKKGSTDWEAYFKGINRIQTAHQQTVSTSQKQAVQSALSDTTYISILYCNLNM